MKKFFQLLALFLTLTAGIGCKSTECHEKPNDHCVCTFQYDPVCGCNEKTYGNACEAACNGITKYKKGACN